MCRCECGKEREVFAFSLRKLEYLVCLCDVKSSDDRRAIEQPEWHCYSGMLNRCLNTRDKQYGQYGGRGITVCDKWQKGFWRFLEDMGPRPSSEHSLDRYPNQNGNYEPGNVRWATSKEQQRNMRSNRLLEFRGETRTVAEWAELLGLKSVTIRDRLDRLKWPLEKALTQPPAKRMRPAAAR